MLVTLVMFKADGTRRDFDLRGQRMTIGRKNSCDLRIPLSSVSRQHCEVQVEGDQVVVADLGSSNGTFLNDQRVQRETLHPGDALVVGPVVFTIVIDGEPTEVKPVRTLLAVRQEASGMGSDAMEAHEGGEFAAITDDRPSEQTRIADTQGQDPIAALQAMADEEEESLDFDVDEIEIGELDDDMK
jgi:pSer/pThr/pTyr-binding forkhead associated (FHA) protein